jgi:hypothetical protein
MTRLMTRIAGAVAVAAVLASGPALAGGGRVVVELFTSQGCSSCPPADRLLGELAARDDVIALSFHVDYWNYLGWADPFSSAAATERQRAYRESLGLRYVYTPQMVIGGAREAVGSHRDEVLQAIEQARSEPRIPVEIAHPDADTAIVTIGEGPAPARPAAVWLFAFDRRHSTAIRRGENEGVTLTNSHVVRAARRIGTWSGQRTRIELPLAMMGIDGQDGCAVIVQPDGGGRIHGAAMFPLKKGGT